MSKKIQLVRAIGGVVHAFLHGEKAPEGDVFRTRCERLTFDGKRLHLLHNDLHPGNRIVYGIVVKPGKEFIVTNRWCDWTGRIEHALKLPENKAKTIHSFGFRWYVSYDDDSIKEQVIGPMFSSMESQARISGTKNRDQVVADWNCLCHAIGLGHLIGPPPDTGY